MKYGEITSQISIKSKIILWEFKMVRFFILLTFFSFIPLFLPLSPLPPSLPPPKNGNFSSSSQLLSPTVTSQAMSFRPPDEIYHLSSLASTMPMTMTSTAVSSDFTSHQYLNSIPRSTSDSICPKVNLLASLSKLCFLAFLPQLMLGQGTHHLPSDWLEKRSS